MNNNKEYAPQNYNRQFEEEQLKYELSKNKEWSDAIITFEDQQCFEGRIKFLLDYSEKKVDKFNEYAKRTVELLNDQNCKFECLLMDIEKSSYPCQLEEMAVPKDKRDSFGIQTIKQFTFSNKGKSDRDFGWHRLLNDNPDEYVGQRKDSLIACQNAAKDIICNEFSSEVTLPPKSICEWKQLLIKCPKLIKYCVGTIMYHVTHKDDPNTTYYLSTDTRDHLFSKRNKIAELYTRYLFEKIHQEGDGWEYITWSYKDNCNSIDCYLKKDNIEIRRKSGKWEFKKIADIDSSISVDDLVTKLKEMQ